MIEISLRPLCFTHTQIQDSQSYHYTGQPQLCGFYYHWWRFDGCRQPSSKERKCRLSTTTTVKDSNPRNQRRKRFRTVCLNGAAARESWRAMISSSSFLVAWWRLRKPALLSLWLYFQRVQQVYVVFQWSGRVQELLPLFHLASLPCFSFINRKQSDTDQNLLERLMSDFQQARPPYLDYDVGRLYVEQHTKGIKMAAHAQAHGYFDFVFQRTGLHYGSLSHQSGNTKGRRNSQGYNRSKIRRH